ncbi:MAG: DUF1064 domain-containing protein [Gilliamella sp.]|jgi:hypothetical protein|uniref:DUF1064 domain-containing protein n=1 Tax=unclassified Gilliamella TaxID=2685620 RepID=UPI00080E0DFA|nr:MULTISPECIES: DUF1064 domain-containing protein [Gilliamella]MCO6539869.1 DUF1064 domain-containing protein [Gilliamella sp.]OCG64052.1 DUF1064 domain-containing protein [Gilliamella apicola]
MRPATFALGRLKSGQMNKTETEYYQYLKTLEQANEIIWFKFEGLKFKLANNTTYTPDFVVMNKDGLIELHEVKGFWMDDARVKIKVAADMYPFKFLAIKKKAKKLGGGWEIEEF